MARTGLFALAAALLVACACAGTAAATPLSVTRLGDPRPHGTTILTGTTLGAPMAALRFCLDHPQDCLGGTGPDTVELTEARWDELAAVNRAVNAAIVARPDRGPDAWSLGVAAGDCDDFAVQKRHDLIARGWPAAAVRLAVVRTRAEFHLVAVVRTDRGDLVLDNMTDRVLPWERTGHRFLMISRGEGPRRWAAVEGAAPALLARAPLPASPLAGTGLATAVF